MIASLRGAQHRHCLHQVSWTLGASISVGEVIAAQLVTDQRIGIRAPVLAIDVDIVAAIERPRDSDEWPLHLTIGAVAAIGVVRASMMIVFGRR